jgi:chromosome segregation ATPase
LGCECSLVVWSEATQTKVGYGVYPIVSAQGKQENRLRWSCRIIGKNDSRVIIFMRKILLIFAVCLFGATVYAQSLGDVARANRAKKHASSSTVKLDDDSMPHSSAPSAGSEADAARKSDDKSAEAKEADQKDAKKDSADAQKQKNDDLKKQIESEKKEVATLQRELDIAQREARLRAAAFYGDAGTMLRDQTKFAEDTRKQQDEINGKKQALDAAQQKLDALQEQARKAGMPSE